MTCKIHYSEFLLSGVWLQCVLHFSLDSTYAVLSVHLLFILCPNLHVFNFQVYVQLIKLILQPNSSTAVLPGTPLSPITAQPDLETALQLLEQFASRMDPLAALAIIPDSVHVSRIYKFLQAALHRSLQERRKAQLLKGLLYAEHLQCQETRLQLQSQSVEITDLNVCPVCKKRFGNQR